MKKIVYFIDSESHYKVFEPFIKNPCSNFLICPGLKYRNINNAWVYESEKHAKNILNNIKPDVFVQSRGKSALHSFLDNNNIKKVLIGHGVSTNSEKVAQLIKNSSKVYNSYDMICAGTQKYDKEPYLRNTSLKDDQIQVTGLSQFDTLFDIMKKTKRKEKSILFAGGFMLFREGEKYRPREEYYKYILYLSNMCSINGWNLIIKPRADDINILKNINEGWAKEYVEMYKKLLKNGNIKLVDAGSNIYDYFYSSMVIIDGWSTLEIEACLANIPLIIIDERKNTNDKDSDFIGSVSSGAARLVDCLRDLDETIVELENKKVENIMFEGQNKLISDLGIKFDGKTADRIVEAIERL